MSYGVCLQKSVLGIRPAELFFFLSGTDSIEDVAQGIYISLDRYALSQSMHPRIL